MDKCPGAGCDHALCVEQKRLIEALTALREERDAAIEACPVSRRQHLLDATLLRVVEEQVKFTFWLEGERDQLRQALTAKDAEIEKLRERERRYENAECVTCGRDLTSQREAQ